MPNKPKRAASERNAPAQRNAQRTASGKFTNGNAAAEGFRAPATLDIARARRDLNLMTIQTIAQCWREGGQEAMRKVMKNSPAQFAKLAVLLVPRELEVTQTGGVRGMSDEQLEAGIAALEALLARRAAGPGADAKVIDAEAVRDTPGTSDTQPIDPVGD